MSPIQETIYRPETGRGEVIKVFKELKKNLPQSISLGYRLAQRNIKAQYRQSMLGIFWALIPPLATAIVWIFLRSQNVFEFEGLTIPYPVFVLIGTLLWQVFSESITILLSNLSGNRGMMSKINFPHEALIVSAGMEILFNIVVKLFLLTIALIAFSVVPSIQTLYSIASLFGLMILGMGIGLIVAPLAMLYRDILMGLPIALQFAMYITPVVYPEPRYSGIGKILDYNPVTPLLSNAREWLFGMNPPINQFLTVIAIGIILFLLGLIVFKLSMHIIIERIGS